SHPGRVLLQRSLPVGAPPSVRLGRAGNYGAAGGHSHPGRVLLQRSLPVGAPPRCDWGVPATPAPPAGIRTRGGCSYNGVCPWSTALGAIGACRQRRCRRWAFAPGAGAPTTEFARRSTALGAIGTCRQLRCRRWAFAPGAGAPTTEFARRSTAFGAWGRAGHSGAPGGGSH